jgi:hypothetical protein
MLLVVVKKRAADGQSTQECAESARTRHRLARIIDVEPTLHAGRRELLLGYLKYRRRGGGGTGLADEVAEPTADDIADESSACRADASTGCSPWSTSTMGSATLASGERPE